MRFPHRPLLIAGLAAILAACQTPPPEPPVPTPSATPPQPPASDASPGIAPATPPPPLGSTDWTSMFNGRDLTGWVRTDFGGGSEPEVVDGTLLIPMSASLGGVNWTNLAGFPTTRYEIELEAMKLDGSDFFCGLTFPVGDSHCSLIVGGWGGGIVGLSSLDGRDASENETSKDLFFTRSRWFPIRLRVTPERISVWIEEKPAVDVSIVGKQVSLRSGEIELSRPLGIATYQTTAAFRNLRFRRVP